MTNKGQKRLQCFISFWVVAIGLSASSHPSLAKCPTRMGSEFPQDSFLVIAHRGSVTKFPENTIPAFHEALNVDGANALEVDLSFTQDGRVILWHDWDPNHPIARIRQNGKELAVKFKPSTPSSQEARWRQKTSALTWAEFREHYGYEDKATGIESDIPIPTFQEFMKWAAKQDKLKSVRFKLKVPAEEIHLASVMFEEMKRIIGRMDPKAGFESVFVTPHSEVLKRLKNQFGDFLFSYDREIPPAGITNYHRFTTVPSAMHFKNSYASLGNLIHTRSPTPDPWLVYRYILTLDFAIRDNYKKSTSQYIKIISWTFNDEKKIRCLINLGVDGIVTDTPGVLRRVALEMGKVLD